MRTARPLIIVAEDEAMLRIIVAQNLEECGFEVLEAADGLAAWNFAQNHPDCRLVMSDVRMPNVDGYTLAQNLLKLEPHPPILLLTDYADPMPPALKERVTLLRKPVTMEELCARAKSLCGEPGPIRH